MKNRREAKNRSLKFKGSSEKFNALLDAAELCLHKFLSEKKNPSRLTIVSDQPPRKKRSLRSQPKKKITEDSQKSQLVLLGFNFDWVVVVKEKLKSQIQEKSSSGGAMRLRPEIPDLNMPPPPASDDDMMIYISD